MKLQAINMRDFEAITFFDQNGKLWKLPGLKTVEVPDTVGYAILGNSQYYGKVIEIRDEVKLRVPKSDKMMKDSEVKVQ